MAVTDRLFKNSENEMRDSLTFKILKWIVIVVGVIIILSILFPTTMSAILNVFWLLLMASVIIFFGLGVLVVVGLKKEAQRILDVIMEGSLTFVDFLEFLKLLWKEFIRILKEFLLYASPVFAYVVAAILYVLLLISYKMIGKTHDMTAFTVGLTAVLVGVFGFMTKPKEQIPAITWIQKMAERFKAGFIDGFEVILFVFFLTMDSTNLFFLPPHLNIELKATWKDYDLMLRGFNTTQHFAYTINIIVFAISLEILRNIIKLIAVARKHYAIDLYLFQDGNVLPSKGLRIKKAIRKSFNESKDDLVRFITFTTVLFAAFLMFPRLKLVTLAVASVIGFLLDIFILDRLYFKKSSDLISRILTFLFKL